MLIVLNENCINVYMCKNEVFIFIIDECGLFVVFGEII